MSAETSGDRDGRRPAPPADRLAELRRERADRLVRLRGGPDAVARAGSTTATRSGAPAAAPSDAEPALAAFLRALRAAIEDAPPAAQAPAAARGGFSVAAVLPFQRAPDRFPDRFAERAAERTADRTGDNGAADPGAPAAAGDLDRLPGIGPGLVWALERAGVARLSDLAVSAPVPLADRLGPIGGLVDLPGWIAFARSATETGAPAA